MAPDAQDRIDLHEILGTLRRGAWVILLSVLLFGVAAFALSASRTKQYTASASLLFRDPAFDQKLFGSTFQQPSQDPDRQAATNVQLVGLRQVAQRTADRGDIGLSEKQLENSVDVSSKGRSDIVTIKATNEKPRVAQKTANAFAAEFIAFRRDADRKTILDAQRLVQRQIDSLRVKGDGARVGPLRDRAEQLYVLGSLQTGNAELVQPAELPDSPTSPRPLRSAIVGMLFGGLLGVALVLLRARLDRRLRTADAVEQAFSRPVLAMVPIAKSEVEDGLPERRSHAEEAFSTLWTNLRYFNVTRKIDAVIVTSPRSGDGKTTVALNLATAAARAGSRVLLLEADLRRPSLSSRLGPAPRLVRGLTQVLAGTASLEDVTVTLPASESEGSNGSGARHLDLVVAGPVPPNPAEMLDSEPMRNLLREARARYDLVVIDAPPSTVVPDAIPLLQQVSAVLVVAHPGTTTRDEASELSSQLSLLEAPLVGVVANYSVETTGGAYYYGEGPTDPKPRNRISLRKAALRS